MHHVLVLPSRYKGTPLVLIGGVLARWLEISAAGGTVSDIFEHCQNGFSAEAPAFEHLQGCLEEAWATRSQWESRGRSSHAAAAERAKEDPAERLNRELLEIISWR
jgi:hypothetical protein